MYYRDSAWPYLPELLAWLQTLSHLNKQVLVRQYMRVTLNEFHPSRRETALMKAIRAAAAESSYPWLPTALSQSEGRGSERARQQFLFEEKKREELPAWESEEWVCERQRERERERQREREREAYWGDPAAPRYLATALHMLTDLLATIIRVYITLLCSALLCSALHCTGSSCNCLLHLRSPINMTQPYTWLQNVTFVICFDPGLDRDQRASAFSSLACTQRAATTSQAIVRSNQAAFYLTEKTLFPFNWRSVILKIIWHAKRCLGVGTVAHCAIWLVRK